MSDRPDPKIIVRYNDGTEERFELLPEHRIDAANMASRLHEVLGSNHLMLELGEEMLVIPMQSIRSISILPLPPRLPKETILGVRRAQT